jgi:DNA-binding winged helix-turn-helix (wHTH) protein/predicted ATPase
MHDESVFHFDTYRLDPRNACVWYGQEALRLTAKAFTVLHYLIQHAGQLVTKEALFQAIWPDTAVSDAALTICIGEIRKALGDSAQAPRFIATVHRRGYRFIAPVRRERLAGASGLPWADFDCAPPSVLPAMLMVGREAELACLDGLLAQARRGARQVVLVAGEAGIGKTTVVDAFLARAARATPLTVAWGQCIPHYGAGEAYLPVLDALGRVCQAPGQERLRTLLGQYAPTWLVQMPALLKAGEMEVLQRQVAGATRERMLREITETLEAMAVAQPLVLVLEDLHWSDHATLDLITWLARRREPAPLLLLGTYRPIDVITHGHPLKVVKQDLALHRQCVEVRLEGLSETAVATYLSARFPGRPLPPGLASMLYQRTEGQPLFLTQVVDTWVQHGWVAEVEGQWTLQVPLTDLETGVPESVRQMILRQFDECSAEEQRVLEAASVVGVACATAAVAAGLEAPMEHVEGQCEALVRRSQFLQTQGVEEWPDGTIGGRYAFLHALYQQVVYEQLPVGRRLELHRRIGRRLEAGYTGQTSAQAAALAVHFDCGREAGRAAQYMQQAAATALSRYAYQEALAHLRRALALVATLPETPARAQQELDLRLALGPALIATQGTTAPEVEQTYARARVLCAQVDETPQLLPTLQGLCRFYRARGALATSRELAEQLYRLAQRETAPMALLEAHDALGNILFFQGEYATARTHIEHGIALTDLTVPRGPLLHQDVAPGVRCLALAAHTLWCLGYPAQAVQRSEEMLTLAQTLAHPQSLAVAQYYAAYLHHRRREAPIVQAQADALFTLGTAQGFPLYIGYGTLWRGWALAVQGQREAGLAFMRQGLSAVSAIGQTMARVHFLVVLAEVLGQASQVTEGLRLLAEALEVFHGTGRGDLWTEAYRLQGELLLAQHGTRHTWAEAEACFQQALALARRQQAKAWELRAALSLSRLWQQQGKCTAAYELLAPLYGWFTEGFDTADLQDAKALLDVLA